MKVSVIVPVYNAKEYLTRCVDSIFGQTYRDFEVVFVDDGSDDGSGEWLDALEGEASEGGRGGAKDPTDRPQVRVVHQENGGLVRAWRSGVQASTGDYLMFVDADDWIAEGMLETLASKVDDSGRKQVITCNHVIDRADGSLPKEVRHGAEPGIYEGEVLTQEIKKKILGNEVRTIGMSRCMKLIERSLITDNIGWSDVTLRMGEDVAIMLPALLDAERIVVLPGHYDYHYYYNPASMVHTYDATMTKSIHRLAAIIGAVLEKKFGELGITDVDTKAMTQREYQYLFTLLVKNELRRSVGAEEHAAKLVKERRMPDRMAKYPASAKDPVNAAIFLFMKHPSEAYAKVLRTMMQIKP